MAGGQNDSRVTEPALPALAPDGLDAVVFDTDGVAGFLDFRDLQLPWGDPSDPPDRETVCGLGNAKDRSFVTHFRDHGATPFPTSVAFVRRLRERGLRTAVVSATGRGGP